MVSDDGFAVAIFQASHSRNAAPHQFMTLRIVGCPITSWPTPNAAQNSNEPIPVADPSTHGRPRTTPTAEPVAVIITLLGPGVIAATTAKAKKARHWSSVMEPVYTGPVVSSPLLTRR
jgi:hypothetical protein